jgi:hypothetical protein
LLALTVAIDMVVWHELPRESKSQSMSWPTTNEYNEAIQNLPATAGDDDLRRGEPALNSLGIPSPFAGGFADVYKIHCPHTGKTWAVKCFTREVRERAERYQMIAAHLQNLRLREARHGIARLPFMVDFNYLDRGLLIRGDWYPVLKMRWVEGLALHQFVRDLLDRPRYLKLLLDKWLELSVRLRNWGMAHADLQHGNVLLVPRGERQFVLRLVDYDGMYVPELSGKGSAEKGHPAYQHPKRLQEGTYNAEVDRFSHLAIYSTIRCLMVGQQELWGRFHNGDNLVFQQEDYRHPGQSAAIHTCWDLPDAEAQALVGRLILATRTALEQVPLLDQIVHDGHVSPLEPAEEREVRAIINGRRKRSAAHLPYYPPQPQSQRGPGRIAWQQSTVAAVPSPLSVTGAPVRHREFHCRKRGAARDQFRGTLAATPAGARFAIAHADEESPFATLWADVLVQQFTQAAVCDPKPWPDWLPAAQEEWSEQMRNLEAPWFSADRSKHGALASFLGLQVTAAAGTLYCWQAFAAGQCCLFHTRGSLVLAAFPIGRSADSSLGPRPVGPWMSALQADVRCGQGECALGDRLWLMNGTLAQWFMTTSEAGEQPAAELEPLVRSTTANDRFVAWIEMLRNNGRLQNDDVTLISVLCAAQDRGIALPPSE